MKPAINLVDRAFGRLTVLAREGSTRSTPRRPLWRCRCACGRELVVLAASLLAGRTRSCGCLRVEVARRAASVARALRWAHARSRPRSLLPRARRRRGPK
jgi:hypothetical protein